MPVSKSCTIKELLEVVDEYILKTKRRVMFEYLLIKGVNDSIEDAKQLSLLMKKPLYMVNLIPYNLTGKFKRSLNINKFKEYLEKQGISTTQRYEFGS
ncbi:MAG: Ribosomal RNA large subunit methyltransferase N, partial [Parcubacteria bacterium 34_609]